MTPDTPVAIYGLGNMGYPLAERVGRRFATQVFDLDAAQHEGAVAGPLGLETDEPLLGRLLPEPFHVLVGLGAERVDDLDLEDQMDAALEIEAEVDLLFRGVDRPERQGHGADDQYPAPGETVHCLLSS